MNYEIGKMIVDDTDDFNELLGLKAVIDLNKHEEENDFEPQKIGECIIYVFNDEEEDIFISADAHSQRLCNMVSNTVILPFDNYSERFEMLALKDVVYSEEKITYIDGETAKGAYICGKVALIEDLKLEYTHNLNVETMKEIVSNLLDKVNRVFNVDFFVTDKYLYDGQISDSNINQDYVFLQDLGFVKTGLTGYIKKM